MPAAGGNGLAMRTGTLLEAYARFADVDCLVLPFAGSATDDGLCRRHAARVEIIEVAGRAETPFALLASIPDPQERLAAFRAYGIPSLTAFLSVSVRQQIGTLLRHRSYDLVHLSRAYLLPLRDLIVSLVGAARFVVDLDEDEPTTRRSLARVHRLNGDTTSAAWQEVEASAYERLLRSALPRIGLALVSSELELKRTLANGALPSLLAVVPNAVSVLSQATSRDEEQRLIFVGGFGYFPNRDATHWMLRSVWPVIATRCPRATLSLVGEHPDPALRRAARRPGIRLCDNIRHVSTAYRRSAVAIVPIRAGGGTRIKLLEAGAYGLPCVSTRTGAEGLAGAPVAIADRDVAFADACVELLRSRHLRHANGQALRRYVRRRHNRGLIISSVVRLASSLC
jgi:glycosyltransferase involved in cell wall biosynthesis